MQKNPFKNHSKTIQKMHKWTYLCELSRFIKYKKTEIFFAKNVFFKI